MIKNTPTTIRLCGLLCATVLSLSSSLAYAQIDEDPEAGDSDPTKPPAASENADRQAYLELLAQTQPADTVQWLSVGNNDFLALYQPALRPSALGTVLLLHDSGEHPDWPGILSDLRLYLPDQGWATLSIALPEPDKALTPINNLATTSRPREVDLQSQAETDDIFDPEAGNITDGVEIPTDDSQPTVPGDPGKAEEMSVDRIIAANTFLQEMAEGPVVLYGQGTGATRAGEFLQEAGLSSQVTALVFVDANNRMPTGDFNLSQILNNPNLPVLDLVQTPASTLMQDAEERQKQAKTIGMQRYRFRMVAPPSNSNLPTLKLIYGFLESSLQPKSE